MKVDLSKIEKFYQSDLGIYAGQVVSRSLSRILSSQNVKKTVCVCSSGFFHYVPLVEEKSERLALQSYDAQKLYPKEGEGHHLVVDRMHWPYRAEDADFVMMAHDVEFAENAEEYLSESWRVLKGEGQLIIVFPNRSGKWAKYDNNPFGAGYPYTFEQMQKLLARARFSIEDVEGSLFFPAYAPKTRIGNIYRIIVDYVGKYLLLQPGVIVVRAAKHVYSPSNGMKVEAVEKAKQMLFPKPVTTPRHNKEI